MSAPALAWVASIKVGNQTAKQLLQFYASHNFSTPGFEFKVATLADQLEVSERSIRKAHRLLIDKNLIVREERFAKDGSQLSSITYLNVPQAFMEKFYGIQEEGGRNTEKQGGGTPKKGGAEQYSDKIININNKNKIRERETFSLAHFDENLYDFNEQELRLSKLAEIQPHTVFEKFRLNLKKKNKNGFTRDDFHLWLVREIEFKERRHNSCRI